jgi:hypothetical protein
MAVERRPAAVKWEAEAEERVEAPASDLDSRARK